MEVILIVGEQNAGKTTLVRSLSGIGGARYTHPDIRNTATLEWTNGAQHDVFVIARSINEGRYYPFVLGSAHTNEQTIAPWHLSGVLDQYGHQNSNCAKAILCIRATITTQGWTLKDYATAINDPKFPHTVTHTVRLSAAPQPIARPPLVRTFQNADDEWFFRGVPERLRNQTAVNVRKHIGLI